MFIVGLVGCSRSRPESEGSAGATDDVRIATTAPNEIIQTLPTESAPQNTVDTLRFLLLAPRGPVLIEVSFSINGRAPTRNITPAIEYTLASADTNADGIASWAELANNAEFASGPLLAESMAPDSEASGEPPQTDYWAGEFDTNQNNIVDREEVLPFLTNFDTNKLIVFNSGPSFHERQHFDSTVLQVVDVNNDEQFGAAELRSLRETILRYDYNDDECITPAELSSSASPNMVDETMMSADVPTNDGQAGLILYRDRAWIRNHFLLRQRYGVAGRILADGIGQGLFDALNANDDDQIDEYELRALCTIPPHISVRVDFGGETEVTATCTLGSYISTSQSSGQFRLPGLTIQCGAQDTDPEFPALEQEPTAALARQSIAANRIQLAVHDQADAVFSLLDSSGDGRLNPREIRAASGRIVACDSDGDGRIFVEEISPTMQFAVTRGGDRNVVESTEPRPVLQPNRHKQVEWFLAMDSNSDGELSRLEFLGTIEQFDASDKNKDDFLSVSEATDFPQ